MRQEHWALVAVFKDPHKYESIVNLLILTFRMLASELSPMIKYRLSSDYNECAIIHEELSAIRPESKSPEVYNQIKLKRVDALFSKLLEADHKSDRLHNAYYFLYLATHTVHWVQSYLFHMNALEALFGGGVNEPVKQTVKRRVCGFLGDPNITQPKISKLYDLRSKIAHGALRADLDPDENLNILQELEVIVISCVRKLAETNGLMRFSAEKSRRLFLQQYDPPEILPN